MNSKCEKKEKKRKNLFKSFKIKKDMSEIKNEIKSFENFSNFYYDGIFENSDMESEAVYFTCLKLLSETLAKMPVKLRLKKNRKNEKVINNLNYLLQVRPNENMSPSTFWASIERCRNHFGNAYILIYKKNSRATKIDALYILKNENVEIITHKNKIYYVYNTPEKQYIYSAFEILHFKTSASFDGIVGKSVKEILNSTVTTNINSQNFIKNIGENSVMAKAVMEIDLDIETSQREKIKQKLEEFATGIKNSGRIIPLPEGVKLKPFDVKLTDSQFLEIRKYNSLQIAMAFGIKPDMINDYSKSSYSNSEMQQLSFYIDTMQFILKNYEDELNYKLLTKDEIEEGYFFKFNEKVMLRTNNKEQSEILAKYINNGIYTPNEARALLDLDAVDGGDRLVMNGNYIPIQQVGEQYQKGS